MIKIRKIFRNLRIIHFLIIFGFIFLLASCKENKETQIKKEVEEISSNQIEIITENMDFQTLDTIPSGWNTFHYINKSDETHFFLIDKYPEGKSIKDLEKEIAPVFQSGMDLITEGKPEQGFEEFGKLPEWFFQIVFTGGSGLISGKHSGLTTLKLDPGYYILECYVKMPNGTFHTTMGMTKPIVVLEKKSTNKAPKSTVDITISSTEGIVFNKTISKGSQTFSVYYKDQIVHENFVGHDVNLVKLDNNADLKVLEKWINWADPKGLISPAPEGFVFLGGVNDMPGGSTGYFSINLAPGNYAFISEVPNASSKNMLKTFSILE